MTCALVAALAVLLAGPGSGDAASQALRPYPVAADPRTAQDHQPRLELRLLCSRRWYPYEAALVRLIVTDHATAAPMPARLTLTLAGPLRQPTPQERKRNPNARWSAPTPGDTIIRWSGRSDMSGSALVSIHPGLAAGTYELRAQATTGSGNAGIALNPEVANDNALTLATDRPAYIPGQTIRCAVLGTRARDSRFAPDPPITGRGVAIELLAGSGAVLDRSVQRLSALGCAAADLRIPSDAVASTLKVTASLPGCTVEQVVRVVGDAAAGHVVASVTTERAFYQPGETLRATVHVTDLAGRPTADVPVGVTLARTGYFGSEPLAPFGGKSDPAGVFRFEYRVPFQERNETLTARANVTDAAGNVSMGLATVAVSRVPVQVEVAPGIESVTPGRPMRMFVWVVTPDGKPIPGARVRAVGVHSPPTVTDAVGTAELTVVPDALSWSVPLAVALPDGSRATRTVELAGYFDRGDLALRLDRTVVQSGASLGVAVQVRSGVRLRTVYLDVERNGQVVSSTELPVRHGRAECRWPIGEQSTGRLSIVAYAVAPGGSLIRAGRRIIVHTHSTARQLTAPQRRAPQQLTAAGLGLLAAETNRAWNVPVALQPAFRVLEVALGCRPTGVSDTLAPDVSAGGLERAASVFMAQQPAYPWYVAEANSWRDWWGPFAAAARREIAEAHRRVVRALAEYGSMRERDISTNEGLFELVRAGYLHEEDLRDPWGNYYRSGTYGGISRVDFGTLDLGFSLDSAGPDRIWGTEDDLRGVTIMEIDPGFFGFGPVGQSGFGTAGAR